MNDHDRENLQFLMNASPEILEDWYNSVEEDDLAYASELLDEYKKELALSRRCYDVVDMDIIDFSEASCLLVRFRL